MFPFTKKEASFIRCASPPERVEEDCPNCTYPKPTSCKGFNFVATFVAQFSEKMQQHHQWLDLKYHQ